MTPGYMTTAGRSPTSEGLDHKLTLHYYARMRLASNLAPLLTAAADQPTRLSRVVSVLDPHASVRLWGSGALDFDDLSLSRSFSLGKCQAHATLMTNYFLESMAEKWPRTSWVHAYPSGVDTGLFRDMPVTRTLLRVMKPVVGRWALVPREESGERHCFLGTSGRYAAREGDEEGEKVLGSDGRRGSGCYWVNWDGEVFPPNKKLESLRRDGAGEKVVQHTEEVFTRVCEERGTYP
ncbi:hypothetical protein K461DRAFT_281078 [Myriangium duriaei CBS 260.36]|uniref:Uncharacterized protein n=1 Tax=Myriangium duriaei CBS 260.36 TaxID=1168546 RepID=A0A9P4IXW2_9PEZI|nr:hypothetical protein K461DRAFT_281078 [Myriangium duriaei CBS 260.36]